MLRPGNFILAAAFAAVFSQSIPAAENWDLCRFPVFEFSGTGEVDAAETLIEAQTVVSEDRNSIRLSGDVSLTRAGQKIHADEVLFDKLSERFDASGNVEFEDPAYRLHSSEISVDNRAERAVFEAPAFELRNQHARGTADRMEKLDRYRSRFDDLLYTTCDPDDRDWHLTAGTLQIDDETGRGSATDTTLYFMDVPFLYLPYFQFPIDDRRLSGLLAPRIGYTDSGGSEILLPVYWNLAPNYDMTITPAWYDRRGAQLTTENRYLFRANSGQLDLSYIDDRELGDTRWFQRWRHRADLGAGIGADLLLAEVSDDAFFDDFDYVAPEYNNTRHLERHVSLARDGTTWQTGLLWQKYLTLDADAAIEDRPYDRLPRFTVAGRQRDWLPQSTAGMQLEWVEFDREDSVTGARTHLVSAIDWESSSGWYFFRPELTLTFTDYRLDNNPADNAIERALPTFALDTGLIFERSAGANGQWLQTLEPRLYFLHTPYEDQADIPDFDTALAASTYNNLFRNNRFTGADRVGDATQVTFGLGSRVFAEDSGAELLNARIGQIYYLRDRRVSLDGSIDEARRSDAIAELDIWPNPRTRIASRAVYAEADGELSRKDVSINYADQGLAFNLGYYFAENELEQALISFVYPVNERWTLLAKAQQSLRFDRPVENLLGLSYESCCWGLKILAGQSGDEDLDFAETDNRIYFEITLKGLSAVGQDIDAQLRDAIPGYDPRF